MYLRPDDTPRVGGGKDVYYNGSVVITTKDDDDEEARTLSNVLLVQIEVP